MLARGEAAPGNGALAELETKPREEGTPGKENLQKMQEANKAARERR